MKVEKIEDITYYSGVPVAFRASVNDEKYFALAVDIEEGTDDIIYLFSKIDETYESFTERELILKAEETFLAKYNSGWRFLKVLTEVPEHYLPSR